MSADTGLNGHEDSAVVDQAVEALFRAAPFGIFRYRLDDTGNLIFLGANEASDRILGVRCSELVGKTIDQAFPNLKDTGVPEAFCHTVRSGEPFEERQVAYRDGRIDGAFQVFAYRSAPGRLAVLFRDITRRARIEADLQASEQAFRAVFEQAPFMLVLTDFATGRIHDVNHCYLESTKTRREDVVGFTYEEIGSGLSPAVREELVRQLSETGRAELREARIARAGAGVRYFTISMRVIELQGRVLILSALQDETERRAAREALRESEERYRTLFESADDAVVLLKDGCFVDGNAKCEEIYGRTRQELLGTPAQTWAPEYQQDGESTAEKALRHVGKALAGEPQRFDWVHLKKNGERVYTQVALRAVRLGGEDYLLALVRNVTDQVRMEEQLRQALKMEAVGRLAGGIAHDFNNLLTVISGYGELLLEGPLEGQGRAQAEQIVKAGARATELVRQLLAFSRRQVIQPRRSDLNELVRQNTDMLRRLVGEDIVIQEYLAANLPPVQIDSTQFTQVLMNLASNARDAMPIGGRLVLETAAVLLDATYAEGHTGVQPGPHVLLAVSDTGQGMDEATMARIFEPFYTTKGPQQGTGLGLATVYGIVKQSGGHIWVYSEPGRGTMFKLYIPALDGATEATPAEPEAGEQQPVSGVLLVVEDQEDVREFACGVLRRQGYEVLEARNGEHALEVAAAFSGPIGLLLTDVVMPGMNGRQLAERLRGARPGMRVLYTSGYTENVVVERGVLKPGVEYLEKPFSPVRLLARVREVLRG